MKIIEHIFAMSEKIIDSSNDVSIDWDRLAYIADKMKNTPNQEKQVDEHKIENIELDEDIILKELVSDSVNYCFWQFSSDYRPNDAGSTRMRQLLEENFDAKLARWNRSNLKYQIRRFYKAMLMERFPLMNKRLIHLEALSRPMKFHGATSRHPSYNGSVADNFIYGIVRKEPFEYLFNFLIGEIDGFGEDPFLKRAILFFLQLNRIYGLYENEIKMLPIPADYQVPKMLSAHYSILVYSKRLENKIRRGEHLQENGPEEMAIRAGTILSADILGDKTGWSPADVDGWLFSRRKISLAPFHCCITSNY